MSENFKVNDRVIVNTGGEDSEAIVIWTKWPPAPGLVKVAWTAPGSGHAMWMEPKHLRHHPDPTEKCIKCKQEVPGGDVVWAFADGRLSTMHGDPYCMACLPNQPRNA